MQPISTYKLNTVSEGKDKSFSIPINIIENNKYNNVQMIGYRMSFILIDQGAGIAKVENKQIPYVAPCIFCINETEHIEIEENERNSIRVLLFHPELINSLYQEYAK